MHHFLIEPFQFDFMQRALLACLLIGFTNGFMGAYVVLRRLALLADALSHSLLPGLALGAIFFGLSPIGLFFSALGSASLVALGGQMIARNSRLKDDTAIGAMYTVAFALGILLLRFAPVRFDLLHFLFGNVLGIADTDLWISYAVSFLSLALLVAFQRPLLLTLFEPSVAASQGVRVALLQYMLMGLIVLAMIASLQAVGVVLSLGLLILPAATIYLLSDSLSLMAWGGGLLGLFGSAVGLLISYHTNIYSGPAIVIVLGVLFFAAYLFSPKHGVIIRAFRSRGHLHEESLQRWGGSQLPGEVVGAHEHPAHEHKH